MVYKEGGEGFFFFLRPSRSREKGKRNSQEFVNTQVCVALKEAYKLQKSEVKGGGRREGGGRNPLSDAKGNGLTDKKRENKRLR